MVVLPLARAAQRFVEDRGWFSFGYARVGDHARERFGRSGRWVRDLCALADAARRLPALADAISGDDGLAPIGTAAGLLVGRVAVSESCAEWVALARRVTIRALREEVRRARGAGANSPLGATGAGSSAVGSEAVSATTCATAGARSVELLHDDSSEPSEASDERCTVRFAVPRAVRAAFDETRDLHRALSGGETSLAEFVEALVAEACSGPAPPIENEPAIGGRPTLAAREQALERETGGWDFLDALSAPDEVLAEAARTLRETARLCLESETDAENPDELIRALVRVEDHIERSLGDLLARMTESGAWRRLRFSGVGHYAEERLRISRTQGQLRARLARALRSRPVLREALCDGRVGAEAAWLVIRALRPSRSDQELELLWTDRAQEATIKRLRDEILIVDRARAHRRTDLASAPVDDETWRASQSRRPGQSLDRIRELGACACADPDCLDVIRLALPVDLAGDLFGAVRGQLENLVKFAREDVRDETAERTIERGSIRVARMFSTKRGSVPEWAGLLALIEEFVATWDDPRQAKKRAADGLYVRDGWRCSAPGCTSRRNLEEHHIVYRSRGGSDEPSNLVVLCRFHHQQGEHKGLMRCRGLAPLGIVWSMGRGGRGGLYRNERRLAMARVSADPAEIRSRRRAFR